MNDLENNVPLFKLCKNIPTGEFTDTALVWMRRPALDGISDNPFMVDYRIKAKYLKREMYPAPTLEEIIATFEKKDKYENKLKICPSFPSEEWSIGYAYFNIEKDKKLTNAALRFWFKIRGTKLKNE